MRIAERHDVGEEILKLDDTESESFDFPFRSRYSPRDTSKQPH